MIIAIWGCGGTGKTTLATGLGSIYAGKGTVGIIDPRDGEPGGLPSMGSHRVGHD